MKKKQFIALKHTLFVYICGEPFSEVWFLQEAFRGTGMCPITDSETAGWGPDLHNPDISLVTDHALSPNLTQALLKH